MRVGLRGFGGLGAYTCTGGDCSGSDAATVAQFKALQALLNGAIVAAGSPFTFSNGSQFLTVDGVLGPDTLTVATYVTQLSAATKAGIEPELAPFAASPTADTLAANVGAFIDALGTKWGLKPYTPGPGVAPPVEKPITAPTAPATWPWVVGGIAVAAALATGVVLVVRHGGKKRRGLSPAMAGAGFGTCYAVVENTPGYLPESDPFFTESKSEAHERMKELAAELEDEGFRRTGGSAKQGLIYYRSEAGHERVIDMDKVSDGPCPEREF